jgi:hypothetical protein
MVRPTRWDALVLVRAAVVATVALVLAWLVTAATDEGGVPWGQRVGRTLPLTPLCAAFGAWAALAPARARGEVLALAALGRSVGQIAAAAVLGGASIALAAALAVGVVRSVDVAGFFPTAAHASSWRWQSGVFVNRPDSLEVEADGTPVHLDLPREAKATALIPPHGRAAAATTTALAGLALPMLLAHALLARVPGEEEHEASEFRWGTRTRWAVAVATGVAVAASVVIFQAAAVHLVPAILGALPWAALIAIALWRYREAP